MEITIEERLKEFRTEREKFKRSISPPLDLRANKLESSNEDRMIKGYAIVWGSKNDFNEIVLKGATQNSLNARGVGKDKNKIVVLLKHRTGQPLAKITKLEEDDYGLYFEAEVTPGVSYAEDALAQIRQGLLSQLSYGFEYIWDKVEYRAEDDAYILREIKLWEISVVTFSSDENAQLRSFNEYQKRETINALGEDVLHSLIDLLINSTSRDEHLNEKEEKEERSKIIKLNFI